MVHNLLNYATRLGYIARNPADQVEKPRGDTDERAVYSPEEARQFLAVADEDRMKALWYLAVSIGLRRGELAGLRWRDVELAGRTPNLTVRNTRTSAGAQVAEGEPKTRSSRRSIVLDRGCSSRLREHREAMLSEARLRGDSRLSEYVFVDEWGDPYSPAWFTRRLHALQREAGLPEITLHDLRHTSATLALFAGVHPKVVAERHGHASSQITLYRYSHVVASLQHDAAEAVGRLLTQVRR